MSEPMENSSNLTNNNNCCEFVCNECYSNVMCGSFGEMYYRLLNDEEENLAFNISDNKNICITVDSILHAWHYSYKSFLESIEVDILYPTCKHFFHHLYEYKNNLCSDMFHNQPEIIQQGLIDIDLYLSITYSLITNKLYLPYFHSNEHDCKYFLQLIYKRCFSGSDTNTSCCLFKMFGDKRFIEFSQYRPNWSYVREYMNSYFKLINFCATTYLDLKNKRHIIMILLFWLLIYFGEIDFKTCNIDNNLRDNPIFEEYFKINKCLSLMVGEDDSLNLIQFNEFLKEYFNVSNEIELFKVIFKLLFNNFDENTFENLQNKMIEKKLGLQRIATPLLHDLNKDIMTIEENVEENEYLCFLIGKKFTIDGFIFNQMTFDRIMDIEMNKKIYRVLPTSLDLGYTLFNNTKISYDLLKQTDPLFECLKTYLENLKLQIDDVKKVIKKNSIYQYWLDTIISLSNCLNGNDKYSVKTLITQFASYTQLKYDSSLFAKQHIETNIEDISERKIYNLNNCETKLENVNFFVEGSPLFWESFINLIDFVINQLKINIEIREMSIRENAIIFYENFKSTLCILKDINQKQLNNEILSNEQYAFLTNMLFAEKQRESNIKEQLKQRFTEENALHYSVEGWYPNLFFKKDDSGRFKPIIIDCHRFPNVDFGSILWLGTGQTFLTEFNYNNTSYYGPIFSHYELATTYPTRINNTIWKTKLKSTKLEPTPWSTLLFQDGKSHITEPYTHLHHFTNADAYAPTTTSTDSTFANLLI